MSSTPSQHSTFAPAMTVMATIGTIAMIVTIIFMYSGSAMFQNTGRLTSSSDIGDNRILAHQIRADVLYSLRELNREMAKSSSTYLSSPPPPLHIMFARTRYALPIYSTPSDGIGICSSEPVDDRWWPKLPFCSMVETSEPRVWRGRTLCFSENHHDYYRLLPFDSVGHYGHDMIIEWGAPCPPPARHSMCDARFNVSNTDNGNQIPILHVW